MLFPRSYFRLVALALTCFVSLQVMPGQAQHFDVDQMTKNARQASSAGDHQRAIDLYSQCLRFCLTSANLASASTTLGYYNMLIADEYMLLSPPDHTAAIRYYEAALSHDSSNRNCIQALQKARLHVKLFPSKVVATVTRTDTNPSFEGKVSPAPASAVATSAINALSTQPEKNRPVKDKWALVIGISKFANPKYNLDFAAKDARDFYNFLVTEANFRKDHVLLLLDDKATRTNIMSAFGDNFLPAVCLPDDLVVVYISTHGTPSKRDKGGRNYIVAHDTDTASLYATGVDMNELYRRIKEGVKTDRALIVMDTCFSGAGVPGAKSLNVADNFDAQEVAQGCGHLVITSSSPNERSWESKVSSNSVFTKYLLEALRKNSGKIDVKSAFTTAQKSVSWEVQNAFGESQTPQLGGQWEGKELILSVPATQPRPMLNSDLLQLMGGNNEPVSRGNAAKDLPVVTKPKKAVPGSDPWKKLERFR